MANMGSSLCRVVSCQMPDVAVRGGFSQVHIRSLGRGLCGFSRLTFPIEKLWSLLSNVNTRAAEADELVSSSHYRNTRDTLQNSEDPHSDTRRAS